jgi:hypothetical protein
MGKKSLVKDIAIGVALGVGVWLLLILFTAYTVISGGN